MSDNVPGGGGDVNVQNSDGETMLYKAAEAGDLRKCEDLLLKGANTEIANNWSVWTPLIIAAGRGHIDVSKVLLRAGAAVDAVTKWGDTPLY